jgi:hypothetical protein
MQIRVIERAHVRRSTEVEDGGCGELSDGQAEPESRRHIVACARAGQRRRAVAGCSIRVNTMANDRYVKMSRRQLLAVSAQAGTTLRLVGLGSADHPTIPQRPHWRLFVRVANHLRAQGDNLSADRLLEVVKLGERLENEHRDRTPEETRRLLSILAEPVDSMVFGTVMDMLTAAIERDLLTSSERQQVRDVALVGLNNTQPGIRRSCLRALVILRDPGSKAALEAKLDDPDRHVRLLAVRILRKNRKSSM